MNTLSELEFFTLVVKVGSLAAAARELDLTPPAVSKRLAQLEERLGVRLLNRTTRRISVTNEGEVYLSHARRILVEIDEMEQMVTSSRAAPKRTVACQYYLGIWPQLYRTKNFNLSAPVSRSRSSTHADGSATESW